MNTFLVLIRGVNVGGKNKVLMSELKNCLENLGFLNIKTYVASGNVIVQSNKIAGEIKFQIEKALSLNFRLDSKFIKVLALTVDRLQAIIDNKPEGFGEHPDQYYSDVIFLMGIDLDKALAAFSPKEGVDKIWPGDGVIYSQRLSSLRTKSHLSRIVGTSPYQSMTIRTWGTVTKLLEILNEIESHQHTEAI